VLALGPVVALPRTAPGLDHVAGEVEHQHRRRLTAAAGPSFVGRKLALGERAGAVRDPKVVVLVEADAGDLPEQPVVGQRLGKERIDLELRHAADLGDQHRIDDHHLRQRRRGDQHRQGDAERYGPRIHGILPKLAHRAGAA
jgi:hypothetical protein